MKATEGRMNYRTIISLLLVSTLFSCSQRYICPAYQTALILDDDYRKQYFSPFTIFEGDTIPKKPYGFVKDRDDTLSDAFYAATEGRGFRIQRGRTYAREKEGFVYKNRKKQSFIARIWSSPERPVLENPYLIDRILKKRPYYKLDIVEPKLINYGALDSINNKVPALTDSVTLDSLEAPVITETILTSPEGYKGYNIDQINYNKKFGHLFPQPPPPPETPDSLTLQQMLNDTTALDTTSKKKGLFGIFKKNKGAKPQKEKKKDRKNNEDAKKEEEDN